MNRISLSQLQQLPKQEQILLLNANGVLLVRCYKGPWLIKLFALDYLYVELYYNHLTRQFGEVVGFTGTDRLEPYLKRLKLSAQEGGDLLT